MRTLNVAAIFIRGHPYIWRTTARHDIPTYGVLPHAMIYMHTHIHTYIYMTVYRVFSSIILYAFPKCRGTNVASYIV